MKTILVDQKLCTRCGIRSVVCPMGIVDPADEKTLPQVQDAKAGTCIRCGHCKVSRPSQALPPDDRPDRRVSLPAGAGIITYQDIGCYLRKRRSVRHSMRDPVSKGKIPEVLDIVRFAASAANGQPVEQIVIHNPKKSAERKVVRWMNKNGKRHPFYIRWKAVICLARRIFVSSPKGRSSAAGRTGARPLGYGPPHIRRTEYGVYRIL